MKTVIKIALLQLVANKNDQEANLKKGDLYCRKAKELGADIILFPEMWNIGYTPFNQDIFNQDYTPEHAISYAEDIRKWQSQAVSLDSNFVQHFRRLAKELNIAIALTYLEKHKNEPRNSISLIDRKGQIQFTYAKVHTCDFSAEAVCAPGDDFYVCDLDTEKGNIRIGAMICFDREFPESARILMLKGAEIILTPNACEMEENRISQFKSRAYENMVGVALANYSSPQNNALMADEKESIFIAEFDIEKIRNFRKREVWGNAFRKPKQYQSLISLDVNEPFIRDNARR